MTGEEIETAVLDCLSKRFLAETGWQDKDFHSFEGLPLELRMIPAHNVVEYNISNGGWAQLLWNCFGSWRSLLAIACDGYRLIGASDQAAALENARSLLERNEGECALFMRRAEEENDFDYFGQFTSISYGEPGNDWENLFWDENLYAKRFAWLEKHQALVLGLLREPPVGEALP